MRIIARPLHDHSVRIEPSPSRRPWSGANSDLLEDPSLQAATGRGWDLLCPYGFEAVWNGGPSPDDIEISAPGFVVSRAGHGVLTFETGLEFDLEPGHDLWVRGPINHVKDGIQPLDQIIEADLLPFFGELHWRFTHPRQIVRFEKGEPFGTFLPYPAHYIEQFQGEVDRERPTRAQGVSCICPTYARPDLLEESIHSFLIQDYSGPKELLILNDYPGQTLEFDHPEVQVINVPKRFRSLGEKMNAAAALCSHDVIFVWSDDDIYLPHRISLSVERLERTKGFFKASQAYFWNDGLISGLERNTFHGGSCWSRDLFTAIRGYPHTSVGVDAAMEAECLRERFESAYPTDLAPEQTYYIYRWAGTGSYHLSALGQPDGDGNANYVAAAAWVAEAEGRGQVTQGRITLRPRWRQDYAGLASRFMSSRAEQAAEPVKVEPVALPPIAFSRTPEPVAPNEAAGLFRGSSPFKMSIVLPACNEAPYLERTFEQFRATLPSPSEIIVVDNGSTDGCSEFLNLDAEMLDPSADCHERGADAERPGTSVLARLFRSPNLLGVAGARNRGLDFARGEVVVFADAHVDVPPGWWQPMVAALNQPGVGLVGPAFGVMGDAEYMKMYGQRISDPVLHTQWLPKRSETPYPVPILGGGFMMLRRDVLEVLGGFDPGMQQWGSEDLEISLRAWLMGYEVWMVPEVEVPHYFRSKNPYHVEWKHVTANHIRTAFLHLSGERLARAVHGLMRDPQFPRGLAICADSDLWSRRADLVARRVHDAEWFFDHPYFRDIKMDPE
jgi:glycosyltransferase involved in cell wall biosynthesis